MLTKFLAGLLGLAFLVVAALGVFPNEWTGPDKPLNFGPAHSVIHFIFGVFLLFGVWLAAHPRFVLRTLGLAYVTVAIIGADRIGDKLIELLNGVQATRWLELALALALVVLGFMAGNLLSRRPAKAAAAAPAEAQEEAAEEALPEKAWAKAEAKDKAGETTPAAAPALAREMRQTEDSSTRLADRIEDALGKTDAEPSLAEKAEDLDRAAAAKADEEDAEPVPEKEKRSFSLFGAKPQPQS